MEQNSGEVLHFRQRKRKTFCRFLSFVPIYGHSQHFSFFYYRAVRFRVFVGKFGRFAGEFGVFVGGGGVFVGGVRRFVGEFGRLVEGSGCEVRDLGGIVYFATGICSFCRVLRGRSAGFAGFSVLRGRREQGRGDFFGRGLRVGLSGRAFRWDARTTSEQSHRLHNA